MGRRTPSHLGIAVRESLNGNALHRQPPGLKAPGRLFSASSAPNPPSAYRILKPPSLPVLPSLYSRFLSFFSACFHSPRHGFNTRTLIDATFGGPIRVRRYLCQACRRTVSLLPEFVFTLPALQPDGDRRVPRDPPAPRADAPQRRRDRALRYALPVRPVGFAAFSSGRSAVRRAGRVEATRSRAQPNRVSFGLSALWNGKGHEPRKGCTARKSLNCYRFPRAE